MNPLPTVLLRGSLLCLLVFLNACGEKLPETPESSPDAVGANPRSDEGDILIPAAQGDSPRPLTDAEQAKVLDAVFQARAKQQAEGLGTGSVKVNGAWNYTGYSYLAPNPAAAIEARLVAVDVTVSGHTPFFDFDDIEIVDGVTLLSYGSDPHAEFLNPDGTLKEPDQLQDEAPAPSRWLLIYAFPKETPAFHLYYWGKQLTPVPVQIAPSGRSLPFPPAE